MDFVGGSVTLAGTAYKVIASDNQQDVSYGDAFRLLEFTHRVIRELFLSFQPDYSDG